MTLNLYTESYKSWTKYKLAKGQKRLPRGDDGSKVSLYEYRQTLMLSPRFCWGDLLSTGNIRNARRIIRVCTMDVCEVMCPGPNACPNRYAVAGGEKL